MLPGPFADTNRYFPRLSKGLQDSVIARTEHGV